MPDYRSKTSTFGRNMAGARALWRATGMKDGDFTKPIVAVANSFTQFVPGHVHLIVKTAGVDEDNLTFEGPARVFESQDRVVEAILGDRIKSGDVVIIRYEGPRGGPGMQEMLYPTSYLKSKGLGKICTLVTDGRFSGGTSGLSIGHVSPEAAEGGNIALIEEGDHIRIDIPNRQIEIVVSDEVLAHRREAMEEGGDKAWKPSIVRTRKVSTALKAFAKLTTSADRGAVRNVGLLD